MIDVEAVTNLAKAQLSWIGAEVSRDPMSLLLAVPVVLALLSRDLVAALSTAAMAFCSVLAWRSDEPLGKPAAVALLLVGVALSLNGAQHRRARRRIGDLERKHSDLEAKLVRAQERDLVRRVQAVPEPAVTTPTRNGPDRI
jgi:hypothetical protein